MERNLDTLVHLLKADTISYRQRRDETAHAILDSVERHGKAKFAYNNSRPGIGVHMVTLRVTYRDREYSVRFDARPTTLRIFAERANGYQGIVVDVDAYGEVGFHDDSPLSVSDVLSILASINDLNDKDVPDLTDLVTTLVCEKD